MPTKRHLVKDGVYKCQGGKFWMRVWAGRKQRKWHKLDAIALRYAIEEARAKKTDHARAKVGTAANPFTSGKTFKQLADLYLLANCPNARLEPRPLPFCKIEKYRIETLLEFFGKTDASEIGIPQVHAYARWRKERIKRETGGERTVELDLVTASNVLNYAVAIGHLKTNGIASGRPKFRPAADVVHSRERAPESGDQIHKIADYLFKTLESEVMGWLVLFSAMTGCRNIELRMLRYDAKSTAHPGFISGNYLFIRRAKSGKFPYVAITEEMEQMLHCYHYWKTTRYSKSDWYFPGWLKDQPVQKDSLRNAMYRANKELGLPNITPHGLRSFYVTKRRGDGIPDTTIAAEIGDTTVSLISTTYGDLPPNWTPGNAQKLSFLPGEGLPAWERWRPFEEKLIQL